MPVTIYQFFKRWPYIKNDVLSQYMIRSILISKEKKPLTKLIILLRITWWAFSYYGDKLLHI